MFGAHDKYTGDGTVAKPQKIIVHPQYNEKNDTNDIALIKVRVFEIDDISLHYFNRKHPTQAEMEFSTDNCWSCRKHGCIRVFLQANVKNVKMLKFIQFNSS